MTAGRTPRTGEMWAATDGTPYTCVVDDADRRGRYVWADLSGTYELGTGGKLSPPPEPWENPQPVEMWGWVGQEGSIFTVTTYPPSAKSRDLFATCQVTVTPIPGTVERL